MTVAQGIPKWASGGGADIVEPSEGQKDLGWETDFRPPPGWMNWFMERAYRHFQGLQLSQSTKWRGVSTGANFNLSGVGWRPTVLRDASTIRHSLLVAVGDVNGGDAELYTSQSDGQSLTSRTSNATAALFDCVWYDDADLWLACGNSEQIVRAGVAGTTWTLNTTPGTTDLRAIAVRNSGTAIAVAVGLFSGGQPRILSSTDGIAWTARTVTVAAGSPVLNDVIYVAPLDLFVAVGGVGTTPFIATSPDGTTWTELLTVPSGNTIHGVAWNGEELIAVGEAGVTYRSTDGTIWTLVHGVQTFPNLTAKVLTPKIAADPNTPGAFFMTSEGTIGHTLFYSVDNGTTWVEMKWTLGHTDGNEASAMSPNRIEWTESGYLIVGSRGTLWSSQVAV